MKNEYVEETVNLLNSEWPRSIVERRRTLETSIENATKSPPQLPISLCLIDLKQNSKIVGHSNVCIIRTSASAQNEPECRAFYLRSLVIDKSNRGLGLGRFLLEQTEAYLKRNFLTANESDCLYLNTKDKQRFYELNNYVKIEPVLFYTIDNENRNDRFNSVRLNLFKSISIIQPTLSNNTNSSTGNIWYKKQLDAN